MRICCRQQKKKFYSKTPDTPAFLQVFNQGRSARITGSSSFDFQVGGRLGQSVGLAVGGVGGREEHWAWGEQKKEK